MQRTAQNRTVADKISASRLQEINTDLDALFARLSNENITTSYNVSKQLTQIVDNENTSTINLDRTDWNAAIPKLYIQEVGDPKRYTLTYASLLGTLQSIVYA